MPEFTTAQVLRHFMAELADADFHPATSERLMVEAARHLFSEGGLVLRAGGDDK